MRQYRWWVFGVVLTILFCLGGTSLQAESLDEWTIRGSEIKGVAYGNNLYVAVGRSGFMVTSGDGVTWRAVESGVRVDFNDILFADNRFVAIGGGVVLTSTNGRTWVNRTESNPIYGVSITYGDGMYMILESGGSVHVSPDTISWTEYATGATSYITNIAYGNGTFVVAGYSGAVLSSTNGGQTWTPRSSGTTETLWSVIWGHNQFVIVGEGDVILTSTDGISWSLSLSGLSLTLMDIAYNSADGIYVATGGNSSANAGNIYTTSDLSLWIQRTSPTSDFLYSVLYGGGAYIIGGGPIVRSVGGIDWDVVYGGTSNTFMASASGNGVMVAATLNGLILRSMDGRTWTIEHKDTETYQGMGYGGNLFLAVGNNGRISTSTDGKSWINQTSGTTNVLKCAAYGNGIWVVGGDSGTLRRSLSGGIGWLPTSSGTSVSIYGLAYGNQTFVAVGGSGTVLTSPDGNSWTLHSIPAGLLEAVVFTGRRFVAVDFNGLVFVSENGSVWSQSADLGTYMYTLSAGNGLLLAAGANVKASEDPASWRDVYPGVSWFHASCFGFNSFYLLGNNGIILESRLEFPWPMMIPAFVAHPPPGPRE